MAINWADTEKAVVAAVLQVLRADGIAAAQEAARGAIFLVHAERLMQEKDATMSASTKAALVRQQKIAYEAHIRGFQGVTKLIAAKALDAAITTLTQVLGKAFMAA